MNAPTSETQKELWLVNNDPTEPLFEFECQLLMFSVRFFNSMKLSFMNCFSVGSWWQGRYCGDMASTSYYCDSSFCVPCDQAISSVSGALLFARGTFL